MKRITGWATLVVAGALLAGCNNGGGTSAGSTGSDSGKKLTIAVIPKGATHEYWKALHAGANDAAKTLGVTIVWRGPDKEDDRNSQVSTVQDFVTQGVDGIVLAPLDENALKAPVKDAESKNIPVLVVDSPLNGGDVVSTVATDNEKGGEIAGKALGDALKGKGKVIMLRYEQGSASTELREKGFLEAIAKFPGITVVSDNQYAGATVDSAQKASENLLAPYKSGTGLSIDGIFCPNESSTMGMLRVLEVAKLAGKVQFFGFDSSKPLVDALKAKEIDGLVVQNPYKMGMLGVQMIVDHIHGKTVDKSVDTGATLVTPDNVNQPDMQKIVSPPEAD